MGTKKINGNLLVTGNLSDGTYSISVANLYGKYTKPAYGIPASDLQEKYIRTDVVSQTVHVGDINFQIQHEQSQGSTTTLQLHTNGQERITFGGLYNGIGDYGMTMGLGYDDDGGKGAFIRVSYYENNIRHNRYYCFEPGYEPEYGAKGTQYLLSNETVGKWQRTTSITAGPLTNINGRTFQNYTATLKTSGYTYYHIQCNAGECSEEEAATYMYYMTGSKFVPKYDYNYPKNSIIIFADGSMWKPQYNSSAVEKFCLFRLQDSYANTFVLRNSSIIGATKCKITYDSKGLVTAGADLSASDIPSLDTSKITSGTFADARIASASAWNAKTKVNLNGSDVTTATIYAPTSSGTAGQVLQSNGSGQAPTWITLGTGGTVTSITAGTGLTTTSGSTTDGGTITASGTLYLTKVVTGATKCKITYDDYGRVTAGANLSASDIPYLDASRITSGQFDKARMPNQGLCGHTIEFEISEDVGTSHADKYITIRYITADGTRHSTIFYQGAGNSLYLTNVIAFYVDTDEVTLSSQQGISVVSYNGYGASMMFVNTKKSTYGSEPAAFDMIENTVGYGLRVLLETITYAKYIGRDREVYFNVYGDGYIVYGWED